MIELPVLLAIETALLFPEFSPELNLFMAELIVFDSLSVPDFTPEFTASPIAFPADFAFPFAFVKELINKFTADFALLPSASNPELTTSRDVSILAIELCALFAFFDIDFILLFTATSATDIANAPEAPAVIATPKAAIPTAPAAEDAVSATMITLTPVALASKAAKATALRGGCAVCDAEGETLLVTLDTLSDYEAIVLEIEGGSL